MEWGVRKIRFQFLNWITSRVFRELLSSRKKLTLIFSTRISFFTFIYLIKKCSCSRVCELTNEKSSYRDTRRAAQISICHFVQREELLTPTSAPAAFRSSIKLTNKMTDTKNFASKARKTTLDTFSAAVHSITIHCHCFLISTNSHSMKFQNSQLVG